MLKIITRSQQIANKSNAKLGGVKTLEGKEKIKFNARKHGILANFISEYEKDVYQSFIDQLFDEYLPQGFLEEILVERIATYYLRLYRAGKAEKEKMLEILQPSLFDSKNSFSISSNSYTALVDERHIEVLGAIYNRYEISIENRLYKAIHELERLQLKRRGGYVPPSVPIDINSNGFVSQNN